MKLIVRNSAEEEDKRELYDAMFSCPTTATPIPTRPPSLGWTPTRTRTSPVSGGGPPQSYVKPDFIFDTFPGCPSTFPPPSHVGPGRRLSGPS